MCSPVRRTIHQADVATVNTTMHKYIFQAIFYGLHV